MQRNVLFVMGWLAVALLAPGNAAAKKPIDHPTGGPGGGGYGSPSLQLDTLNCASEFLTPTCVEDTLNVAGTLRITNSGGDNATVQSVAVLLEERFVGCGRDATCDESFGPSSKDWEFLGAATSSVAACSTFGEAPTCYGTIVNSASNVVPSAAIHPIPLVVPPSPLVDANADGEADECRGGATEGTDYEAVAFDVDFDLSVLGAAEGDDLRANVVVTFVPSRGSCRIDADCDGSVEKARTVHVRSRFDAPPCVAGP